MPKTSISDTLIIMIINEKKSKNIRIIKKIRKFDGFMDGLYDLFLEIHQDIAGDWDFIFKDKDPKKKFQEYVRNLINRGIIDKPHKGKKQYRFGWPSIIQIAAVNNYKQNGISMVAAKNHILSMSGEQLEERLFNEKLYDKDELQKKHKLSIDKRDKRVAVKPESTTYTHIKIGNGIILQLRENVYSDAEIKEMYDFLRKKSHDKNYNKSK